MIVALVLISTESREDEESFDLGDVTISARPPEDRTLSPAELQAAIAQLRTTTDDYRVIVTPTTTTAPAVTVKPTPRPKPPLAGPDLMTGKRVALSQFRGKPVFVSVWASWNVGSIEQALTIGRWARSHENEVAYLGIDLEEPRRDGRAFARRYGMTFPSISDPAGKLYGWAYAPTTLVFDRRHRLVDKIDGSASVEQLNAALRRVAG